MTLITHVSRDYWWSRIQVLSLMPTRRNLVVEVTQWERSIASDYKTRDIWMGVHSGCLPPNLSFSHNSTSLISEFQHESASRLWAVEGRFYRYYGLVYIVSLGVDFCKALSYISHVLIGNPVTSYHVLFSSFRTELGARWSHWSCSVLRDLQCFLS